MISSCSIWSIKLVSQVCRSNTIVHILQNFAHFAQFCTFCTIFHIVVVGSAVPPPPGFALRGPCVVPLCAGGYSWANWSSTLWLLLYVYVHQWLWSYKAFLSWKILWVAESNKHWLIDCTILHQSINQYVFQDFTRILLTGYMVNHSKQSKDRHRQACFHDWPSNALVLVMWWQSWKKWYNIWRKQLQCLGITLFSNRKCENR